MDRIFIEQWRVLLEQRKRGLVSLNSKHILYISACVTCLEANFTISTLHVLTYDNVDKRYGWKIKWLPYWSMPPASTK